MKKFRIGNIWIQCVAIAVIPLLPFALLATLVLSSENGIGAFNILKVLQIPFIIYFAPGFGASRFIPGSFFSNIIIDGIISALIWGTFLCAVRLGFQAVKKWSSR